MKTCSISIIALACLFVSCSNDENDPNVPKDRVDIGLTAEEIQVNKQIHDFSFDFFRAYAEKRDSKTNYVFSPLGLSYCLGMVLNGADGETYRQLHDALGFSGMDRGAINRYVQTMRIALVDVDNTTTFLNANSIWLKNGITFLDDFKKVNQTYYDARLEENAVFDFKTADAINNWCKERTNGMIPNFVEAGEIGGLSALFLNALYFNGKWASPFDASETRQQNFTRADGSFVKVPMLQKESKRLNCVSTDEVTIVTLPYGNGAFVMRLVLPVNRATTIDELLKGLTAERWDSWMEQEKEYMVTFSLPKFNIDYEDRGLVEILQSLGVTDAFTANADFSKMSTAALFINWIKQRSVIRVDEEGTEASVITGTGMIGSAGPPSSLKVAFNRPFAFFISEISTNVVLFAGKVGDPSVKSV